MKGLLHLWKILSVTAVSRVVPLRVRTTWQWYRRAYGGRWSRGITGERWHPVSECPGAFHAEIVGGEGVVVGVCFDDRDVGLVTESEDGTEVPWSGGHVCCCEVWPEGAVVRRLDARTGR